MKRLALLALTAGLVGTGSSLRAGDSVPLPPPTGGMAATVPQVPAPVYADGVFVPLSEAARPRFRDRIKLAGADETRADGSHGKTPWCADCAPAVRHPLPPLPASAGRDAWGGASCAGGACGARVHDDRGCWQCFKDWLCYRQTPTRLGLTPTPRITPLYTYFPCNEHGGYGSGCASGTCGAGVAGRSGGVGCATCPQAGETLMPGYRLASPQGPATTEPATGPVVSSSYKVPATAPTAVKPASLYRPVQKPPVRPYGQQ